MLVRPLLIALSIFLIVPSIHAADVADGRKTFLRKCIGCHAFACNKDGPRLENLFGRKAGTIDDYSGYTDDVKHSEIVWSAESLDKFLSDPAKIFPKSTMASSGLIKDPDQRQNLIAFLKTEDPTVNLCSK